MLYHILVIADLHWGAVDTTRQLSQYSFILDTVKGMKDKLDLVVIAGDYWDSRVMLNGTVAIEGIQWLHSFYALCKECGVKEVRILKGTKGHDNDQLEVFRSIEENNEDFKIFNVNTYEETLPDMRVLYCPEENIPHEKYIKLYKDNIAQDCNIGFFHGGFDNIMPSIAVEAAKGTDTLIFNQVYWERELYGPMFGGHWHNGESDKNVTYIGTPDKWDFSEYDKESPPGIGLIAFDTSDASYYYQKIVNPNYYVYKTFYVDTSLYTSVEEYQKLIHVIDSYKEDLEKKGISFYIRIKINITNDNMENEKLINHLKDTYMHLRRIKIETKNRMQKVKKKQREERHTSMDKKFGFIKSSSLSHAEKLQRYILLQYGEDISLETIQEVIKKYAKE